MRIQHVNSTPQTNKSTFLFDYHVDDEDQNDCVPNPCAHGGTCTDQGFRNFTCECAPRYQGLFCQAGKWFSPRV